jgi:coenzyme F420-0:L-glutamate ligase/coenzyme F420-1:gamma-L-glutamate ligase
VLVSDHGVPVCGVAQDGGGNASAAEETLTDLVAAGAGLILGQRGRGAPVAVLRGIAYEASDGGVAAILHPAP